MNDFDSSHRSLNPARPPRQLPASEEGVSEEGVSGEGVVCGQLRDRSVISCAEFEERVQELLDLRQSPGEDRMIARHASECQPCGRLLADFLVLESVLRPVDGEYSPRPTAAVQRPSVPSGRGPTSPTGSRRMIPHSGSEDGRDQVSAILPKHPAIREQQTQMFRYLQAAVLLVAVGLIGFGVVHQRAQRIAMLPVPKGAAGAAQIATADDWRFTKPEAFRPVSTYRSLEQCYELTSELPGVKPLQASILVALDWWQQYFRLSPITEPEPRLHEYGFGLNPRIADTRYQA